MEKEYMIFQKDESLLESIISDIFTFGFLLFCIWFSYRTNSQIWEFATVIIFFLTISVKIPFRASSRWVKLKNKQEAIAWAESLNDAQQPTNRSIKNE